MKLLKKSNNYIVSVFEASGLLMPNSYPPEDIFKMQKIFFKLSMMKVYMIFIGPHIYELTI